jgi:hypothetical protein
VHQLWNASRTGWNVQLLNRVFWDHDIEVIRKLKIPGGQMSWLGTMRRVVSLRSGVLTDW